MPGEQKQDTMEFMNDMADDNRNRRKTAPLKGGLGVPRGVIAVGAAIVVLIIIIVLLSGRGKDVSTDMAASLGTRIDGLHQRLERLEGAAGEPGSNKTDEAATQGTLLKLEKALNDLKGDMREISRKVILLEKKTAALAAAPRKTEAPPAPAASKPYTVRKGDTLYGIAKAHGLSVDALRRLNKMGSKQAIYPGQKLIVSP